MKLFKELVSFLYLLTHITAIEAHISRTSWFPEFRLPSCVNSRGLLSLCWSSCFERDIGSCFVQEMNFQATLFFYFILFFYVQFCIPSVWLFAWTYILLFLFFFLKNLFELPNRKKKLFIIIFLLNFFFALLFQGKNFAFWGLIPFSN